MTNDEKLSNRYHPGPLEEQLAQIDGLKREGVFANVSAEKHPFSHVRDQLFTREEFFRDFRKGIFGSPDVPEGIIRGDGEAQFTLVDPLTQIKYRSEMKLASPSNQGDDMFIVGMNNLRFNERGEISYIELRWGNPQVDNRFSFVRQHKGLQGVGIERIGFKTYSASDMGIWVAGISQRNSVLIQANESGDLPYDGGSYVSAVKAAAELALPAALLG